jgi:hypothetical protein
MFTAFFSNIARYVSYARFVRYAPCQLSKFTSFSIWQLVKY